MIARRVPRLREQGASSNVIDFVAYRNARLGRLGMAVGTGAGKRPDSSTEDSVWDKILRMPVINASRRRFTIDDFDGMFCYLYDNEVRGEPLKLLAAQMEWFVDNYEEDVLTLDETASVEAAKIVEIMKRMDPVKAENHRIKHDLEFEKEASSGEETI